MLTVNPASAEADTVGAASVTFAITLGAQQEYYFASTTDCWIAQGASPTAVADADGNLFVPAGVVIKLHGKFGAKVAHIQDAAGGTAVIAEAID